MMHAELTLDLPDAGTLTEHVDHPLINVGMLVVQPLARADSHPRIFLIVHSQKKKRGGGGQRLIWEEVSHKAEDPRRSVRWSRNVWSTLAGILISL